MTAKHPQIVLGETLRVAQMWQLVRSTALPARSYRSATASRVS
jgi:hypothetical protein